MVSSAPSGLLPLSRLVSSTKPPMSLQQCLACRAWLHLSVPATRDFSPVAVSNNVDRSPVKPWRGLILKIPQGRLSRLSGAWRLRNKPRRGVGGYSRIVSLCGRDAALRFAQRAGLPCRSFGPIGRPLAINLLYAVRLGRRVEPAPAAFAPLRRGGRRPWFLCPALGCGRRVAILYGGAIFACRHCYRLAYRCQRETADDRAARRADKTRARLGWEPGILNCEGGKPKAMRWRTFERLTAEHDAFVGESLAGMTRRFGLLNGRLNCAWDDLIGER